MEVCLVICTHTITPSEKNRYLVHNTKLLPKPFYIKTCERNPINQYLQNYPSAPIRHPIWGSKKKLQCKNKASRVKGLGYSEKASSRRDFGVFFVKGGRKVHLTTKRFIVTEEQTNKCALSTATETHLNQSTTPQI